MAIEFGAFGLAHFAILAMVPLLAAALAAVHRKVPHARRPIRLALGLLLLACTAAYYASFAVQGEPLFPYHLPLELCDASLWLIIATLLTLNPHIFDIAYYWAIAGAGMALLTPNLYHPSLFDLVLFFGDHGLIVVAALYLVWSRQAHPRRGSVTRAMLAMNVFAALVGTFDFLFKTDYMFLCAKPVMASLLDVLGPWPWYILTCEAVALGLFLLLYLPFRGEKRGTQG